MKTAQTLKNVLNYLLPFSPTGQNENYPCLLFFWSNDPNAKNRKILDFFPKTFSGQHILGFNNFEQKTNLKMYPICSTTGFSGANGSKITRRDFPGTRKVQRDKQQVRLLIRIMTEIYSFKIIFVVCVLISIQFPLKKKTSVFFKFSILADKKRET